MSHSIPGNAIPDLFKGVVFYINDTLNPRIRLALHQLLVEWGAEPCPPDREAPGSRRFDVSQLTHFITDTLDFPEYTTIANLNDEQQQQQTDETNSKGKGKNRGVIGAGTEDEPGDGKVKIVLPAWVTRSFDLQVVQQSRFYSPDPALFLSSTCICTSGLPISDDLTICSAVEAFGGQWRRELTREVTHLICVSEVGKKYEMAIKFGTELGIAIVLPHWFEESLKLNQLVPMDIYRFPSPPYSTSLRDLSSSKTFVERLTDYWKQRFASNSASSNTPSASTSTTTANDNRNPVTTTTEGLEIKTVPTTATHVILGLEEGLQPNTNDKLKESEVYFKFSAIEGFPSELQRELNEGNLMNDAGGGGGRRSTIPGTGGGSEASLSKRNEKLNSTLSTIDGGGGDHNQNRAGGRSSRSGSSREILKGKKFYLSSDLGLSAGIESAIKAKIEMFGGQAWSFGSDGDQELAASSQADRRERGRSTSGSASASARDSSWARRRIAEKRLRESDYVVLRSREGWEYWLAYELDLSIGTPPWLFCLFANQTLSSPLSRLVHYPPPSRDGVDEFRNKTITVSNYTGLAREYVRTLIELLGAKYEGTMGRSTDYVVTASDIGSKCVHAKSWGIPLVTHIWLETCVISWTHVSPALSPAYTIGAHQVGGTMFPTVLGWKGWTREAIKKWADGDERREDREKGRKGVTELEREARDRDETGEDEDELDRMDDDQDDRADGVKKEGKPPEEVIDIRHQKNVEKPREKAKEQRRNPSDDGEERTRKVQDMPASEGVKKVTKSKSHDNEDVDEDESATKRKPKRKSPRPEPMNVDEDEQDQDVIQEPSRARTKSRSIRPASPEAPRNETPDPRPTAKKSKLSKSSKPRSAGKEDNESSALTEDEGSSSSSSSSSESSLPPSAKAMSKHFNKIDAHNLVQPGSKRAAAGKARAALHVAMEDKNQFDQEQKSSARKGGTTRRRSSQGRESGSPLKTKKKVKKEQGDSDDDDEGEEEEGREDKEETKPVVTKKAKGKGKRAATAEDEDDGEAPAPKKRAKAVNKKVESAKNEDGTTTQEGAISSFDNPPRARPPPVKTNKLRIISTGLDLDKTSSEIKDMKALGALWTEKPQEATHLVVKALSRTEKFLCCLPFAPRIVTKKWIDACIAAQELVDETPYLLKDKKKELELGDTLEAILARARKGKMLDGRKVYITKNVKPDAALCGRVVSACGGIIAPNDLVKHHKKIVADPAALVVSCPKDRKDWDKLAGEGIPIYTVEAVFVAAMHQSFEKGFTNDHRVDPQLTA